MAIYDCDNDRNNDNNDVDIFLDNFKSVEKNSWCSIFCFWQDSYKRSCVKMQRGMPETLQVCFKLSFMNRLGNNSHAVKLCLTKLIMFSFELLP